MSAWAFRVVKRARGLDGRWFDFPTAKTFDTEESAREYAARFAASQASDKRVDVRSRRPRRSWLGTNVYTVASFPGAR